MGISMLRFHKHIQNEHLEPRGLVSHKTDRRWIKIWGKEVIFKKPCIKTPNSLFLQKRNHHSAMKNLFIIIFSCLWATSMAQVNMEKVLVEMATATWSNGCASEVAMIEQMQNEGLNICVINYHLNDPFANQYANQRAAFYGIQEVPYPIIGGQVVMPGDYDSYLTAYNESNNTPSSFIISADGNFVEDTLILSVTIQKIADYESDTISLRLAFTESDIAFQWHDLLEVNDVERIMAPNAAGLPLDFSSSNTIELEERILFDRDWDPANMDLVAFIQNDTSKKVLQAYSLALPNFAPLPVHAFFQVDDTILCRKTSVQFENLSTGDIENTYWYFEGGTPEESTDFEPLVTYHTEGDFQVRLVLSNSVSTDTNLINNYIHVKPLPEISFDILPEFCHYHFAYALIEGHPEGGQYSGSFVDSGYFHPEAAGPGIHPIYFSYQNPQSLCSDTIAQDAQVFLCESIEESFNRKERTPLHITNENNTITITFSEDFDDEIQQIQVFDFQGKLIHSLQDIPKSSKNIKFPLNAYKPLLILHVHGTKKIYTLKYKMD